MHSLVVTSPLTVWRGVFQQPAYVLVSVFPTVCLTMTCLSSVLPTVCLTTTCLSPSSQRSVSRRRACLRPPNGLSHDDVLVSVLPTVCLTTTSLSPSSQRSVSRRRACLRPPNGLSHDDVLVSVLPTVCLTTTCLSPSSQRSISRLPSHCPLFALLRAMSYVITTIIIVPDVTVITVLFAVIGIIVNRAGDARRVSMTSTSIVISLSSSGFTILVK